MIAVIAGCLAVSAPASAVSITTGHKSSQIAAEGPHNTLYFYWQTNSRKPWHKEEVAGRGTTYSAPSLIDNAAGVIIAAEGPHHSLRFYWQDSGKSRWHAEVVAGRNTTYSAPSIGTAAVTGTHVGSSQIAAEGGRVTSCTSTGRTTAPGRGPGRPPRRRAPRIPRHR